MDEGVAVWSMWVLVGWSEVLVGRVCGGALWNHRGIGIPIFGNFLQRAFGPMLELEALARDSMLCTYTPIDAVKRKMTGSVPCTCAPDRASAHAHSGLDTLDARSLP